MSDTPLVHADTSALGALLILQAETQALLDWLVFTHDEVLL